MTNHHNKNTGNTNDNSKSEQMLDEKKTVKKDLMQTIIVNIVFIVILVGLFYWNKNNGQPLDSWVNNLIS